MKNLKNCNLCPRNCNINRTLKKGFCGATNKVKLAKVCLVNFEEPCISHKNGSGAIFFSGCNLKCVFCQNYKISSENFGREISINKLAKIISDLENKKADNINLITGSHYVPQIAKTLKLAKPKIPVVFNTGGYDKPETLNLLDGLVNIYIPDFKYAFNDLAEKYSNAPNYVETALSAIKEMVRQVGNFKIGHSGKLMRGVIVRILVLPNNVENAIKTLEILENNFNENQILISLMSQYVPLHNANKFPELNRSVTTEEYNTVLKKLEQTKFVGYTQELTSATTDCIPSFDLSGF